jgi:hypothetical protein
MSCIRVRGEMIAVIENPYALRCGRSKRAEGRISSMRVRCSFGNGKEVTVLTRYASSRRILVDDLRTKTIIQTGDYICPSV